jgi:hypothetical protein
MMSFVLVYQTETDGDIRTAQGDASYIVGIIRKHCLVKEDYCIVYGHLTKDFGGQFDLHRFESMT